MSEDNKEEHLKSDIDFELWCAEEIIKCAQRARKEAEE